MFGLLPSHLGHKDLYNDSCHVNYIRASHFYKYGSLGRAYRWATKTETLSLFLSSTSPIALRFSSFFLGDSGPLGIPNMPGFR